MSYLVPLHLARVRGGRGIYHVNHRKCSSCIGLYQCGSILSFYLQCHKYSLLRVVHIYGRRQLLLVRVGMMNINWKVVWIPIQYRTKELFSILRLTFSTMSICKWIRMRGRDRPRRQTSHFYVLLSKYATSFVYPLLERCWKQGSMFYHWPRKHKIAH